MNTTTLSEFTESYYLCLNKSCPVKKFECIKFQTVEECDLYCSKVSGTIDTMIIPINNFIPKILHNKILITSLKNAFIKMENIK